MQIHEPNTTHTEIESIAREADASARPAPAPPTFRAPRASWWTIIGVSLFLLGALTVMAINVLNPSRAQRLRVIGASEDRLESMIVALEHDNERLMGELQRLERGAQGWQSLARKEYGMLLEGEYVYRFPAAKPAGLPERLTAEHTRLEPDEVA